MGTIRADETARVTDACLGDVVTIDDHKLPPRPLLLEAIEDKAREIGVALTEAEIIYIADVALAWVFKDLDPDRVKAGVNSPDRFLVNKKVW